MSDYLDPGNEELLKDFFVEAYAQIDVLEQNILVLENDTTNADAIDEIFRAAHTLKGASATVQMDELTEFTHLVEDVFDAIRSGSQAVDSDLVDTLLRSVDVIKEMLHARGEGSIYSGDPEPLKRALREALGIEQSAESAGTQPHVSADGATGESSAEADARARRDESERRSPGNAPPPGGLSEYDVLELRQAAGSGETVYTISVHLNPDNPMNTVGGIQVFAALKDVGQVLRTDPDFESLYDDVFHPHVIYWISTERDKETIRERIDISDVVTSLEITGIGNEPILQPLNEAYDSSSEGESHQPEAKGTAREPEIDEPARVSSGAATVSEPESDGAPTDHSETVEGRKRADTGSILRVDSRRIDELLNLVSETVIIKAGFNQLSEQFGESLQELQNSESEYRETLKQLFDSLPDYLQQIQDGSSPKDVRREITEKFGHLYDVFDRFENSIKGSVQRFRSSSQNLGRVTSELQEGVMRIRMVPISQIFSRFPRLVRDLSRSLKKEVSLIIEGEDTELDKSVIEDLLDPLIHCARNSIDHGIETPSERRSKNKPESGTLRLKASNEGNMILIEVSDDGQGIDVDRVRKKAIERGLIHPNKNLSDVEAHNLIFDPGFSTAKEVTNVSGRGVGLDVVRQQIRKLNGTVSVWSEHEHGTRFTIKIPLTLAIIQGLLVRVGKELYAIPITSVLESHRIRPSDIKLIDNYEVINVREDVVSLVRLNQLFRISSEEAKEYHFVVVVGSGDRKMGLIVDELIGEEDVVIKPLRDHYTNVPGIAGANITGDGTVSLIIDVSQLLDLGLQREREQRRHRETPIRTHR